MKKRYYLFVSLLSIISIASCDGGGSSSKPRVIESYDDDNSAHALPQFITNNYGQDASSDLVVQWQNVDGSTNQRVQITTPDDTDFTYAHNVEADYRKFDIDQSKIGNYDKNGIYRAEVTGLKPGKKYIYRVGANGAWSDTYNHYTAEGGDKEFSFTVTSDPQSPTHSQMLDTFNAANDYDPDHRFFFLAGDLVNDMGKKPDEIKSYTAAATEINKNKIIASTQGNHDTYENNQGDNVYKFGQATAFNAFTTFPANGFEEDVNKSNSYYFRYNNLLLISLNTLIADESYPAQGQWLRDVLQDNVDQGSNGAEFIIVTYHIGAFGGREGDKWKEKIVRDTFTPIFSEYKVDLVMNGHDHAYERSNPMVLDRKYTEAELKTFDTTPDPENGTIYTMVGATGPKFYDIATKSYESNIWKVRKKANPGSFVNVRITKDEIEVSAMKLPGTDEGSDLIELDSYTIAKKAR